MLLFSAIFITSFPPLFGYGLICVATGYILGFYRGLAIAYVASLLGAVACFTISKKLIGVGYKTKLVTKMPQLKIVDSALKEGGLKVD